MPNELLASDVWHCHCCDSQQRGNSMGRTLYIIIFLAILIQLPACSPRATRYVHPNVDFSYINRVAIFPFQNRSQDSQAAPRVQSIFMAGILEQVKGTPSEERVHVAALRSMSQARYAPESLGHYALRFDHCRASSPKL